MTRATPMIVARTRRELAAGLAQLRRGGATLGLVPTMGYLHEGHLSLVDQARRSAAAVAASIFVNPLQFAAGEDLSSYPRNESADLEMLAARGTDLVFLPSVEEMYPDGEPRVTVDPGPMGARLCGAWRPGHFRGVLTVVARLFGLFQPDVAVFGSKDYQQAVLIQRMVRDLEMRVRVEMAPLVREADGLAMSSRNTYLSAAQRAEAPALQRALAAAVERFRGGERSAAALRAAIEGVVAGHPGLALQYVEIVDPETLDAVDPVPPGSVAALAAYSARTRLIDNVVLS